VEALARFDAAVAMVVATVRAQTAGDWGKPYVGVMAEAGSRLDMVVQCAAHIEHHIGQMIYLKYAIEGGYKLR
jgi:hypothetical protein